MQLHAVFRYTNLLVKNVKKTYAFHPHYPCMREAPEMRFGFRELGREDLPHFSKALCLRRTASALAFG
jgi:hypothetical protein